MGNEHGTGNTCEHKFVPVGYEFMCEYCKIGISAHAWKWFNIGRAQQHLEPEQETIDKVAEKIHDEIQH